MDAPRSNSPSRKSRFRAQGGAPHRPAVPVDESVPGAEETVPVYREDEALALETEEMPVYAEEPATYPEEPAIYPEEGTVYAEEAALYGEDIPAHSEYLEPSPADPPPGHFQAAWPPFEQPAAEMDSLPAGLRLTRSSDELLGRRGGIRGWVAAVTACVCLLLGALGGYFLHPASAAAKASSARAAAERTAPILPLNPAVLADVDAAFTANKLGQFGDARQRFSALADAHPNWNSMRIEAARATLYEHDSETAGMILSTLQRAGANVDAAFLTGLLDMTTQAYDKSEVAFAEAVAIDPARADIFYFWGECLRREGKPQDAAEKFHQALIRNQYETSEGLYQLKLWLSQIQANQEAATDADAKIDADLASGHPSGQALLAAAARDIKAERFRDAGAHIGQAQKVMEPAVFRVILQDPTFLEQNFRPEIAPFYQQ